MHSLIKKVTLWGLAGIMAAGLISIPLQTTRQVDAKGGYDNNVSSLVANNNTLSINAATTIPFVGLADTWKFFDQGVAPAATWSAPGFDDSAWKTGAAPFGYGGVGEATVVSFGPNSSNKYITTYFRKTFNVDNPASVQSMSLQIVADDGAVAYLNGVVVANPNMPASGVGYSTKPTGNGNKITTTVTITPALLKQGINVLAVEQHQYYINGINMFFAASLTGIASASIPPALTAAPLPADGGLVHKADVWRYFDLGKLPAANWTAFDYGDTSWKSGQAPFGYGGVGEKTAVSFGPNASSKYVTTYFRKAFSLSDLTQVRSLTLEVVADDGAVAYLNGVVVANPNMPASGVGYSTKPTGNGNKIVTKVNVNPALLRQGTNVLAVEQHQYYVSGKNMFFDASLTANAGAVAPTAVPTQQPTAAPTKAPTKAATTAPTTAPTKAATTAPTKVPTNAPTPTKQVTAAPTTPANNSGLPPAPSGQSWAYRWGDEFNGTSIDTSKWQIDNKTRAEDPNKTYYIPQNASVSNGTLKLLVKHETYSGANYTGAMLELTGNYRRNRYGYFEARIKYNFQGPGWWANFWMCGVDQWPPEFDNEIVAQHPGAVYLANHYKDASGTDRSSNTYGALDYNQWHTYGVLWLPGKPVQFYLDGKLAFTASSPSQNPPTVDMYMALRAGAYYNSTWGGTPNSTTVYPGSAEYDWVHVYQAQ